MAHYANNPFAYADDSSSYAGKYSELWSLCMEWVTFRFDTFFWLYVLSSADVTGTMSSNPFDDDNDPPSYNNATAHS